MTKVSKTFPQIFNQVWPCITSLIILEAQKDNKYNSAKNDQPEENDPETDKAIGAVLEDRRKYISRV